MHANILWSGKLALRLDPDKAYNDPFVSLHNSDRASVILIKETPICNTQQYLFVTIVRLVEGSVQSLLNVSALIDPRPEGRVSVES
jgi:hypothetical protein